MGKRLRGTLSFLIAVGLSCSNPNHLTEIRILVPSPIVSIDPHTTEDTYSLAMLANIYEPLVTFGSDMKILPKLATSWSNPHESVWRLRLRKEVKFHDGSAFTSADVSYSINRILHDPKSAVKPWLKLVKQVKIVDEFTIDLITDKPSPFLLSGLANVLMIPAGSGPDLKTRANGTGAYRLKEWNTSGSLLLFRNEHYWSKLPAWEKASIQHHPDPLWRVQKVEQGEADLAVATEPALQNANTEKLQIVEYPAAKVAFLGFSLLNDRDNVFAEPEIRKAISLAINQESLIRQALGGMGQRASQMAPFEVFGYDPGIPFPSVNVKEASEILSRFRERLNEKPQPLLFTKSSQSIAEFLKKELAPLGIRFELKELLPDELDSYLFRQAAPAYIVQMTFPTMDATDVLIDAFHTKTVDRSSGSLNFSGYTNPELDQLLDACDSEMIPEKRFEILKRATRIVLDSNVWIPLCIRSNLFAASKQIRWNGNSAGRILIQEIQPLQPVPR